MEQLLVRFRDVSLRASLKPCSACRSLSTSAARQATAGKPRRKQLDPYAASQARARKAANISRQAELQQARADAFGDPVRGKASPFVQAFDSAAPPPPGSDRSKNIKSKATTTEDKAAPGSSTGSEYLNFSITSSEFDAALDRSLVLSGQRNRNHYDEHMGLDEWSESVETPKQKAVDLFNPDPNSNSHRTATEALRRIMSLSNASSKERLSVNVKRCISTFGRHNTEAHLPSKPAPSESFLARQTARQGGERAERTPRAGPDTGSSEVQIAILTARIRTLAQFVDTRGKPDKMNKRNLRVLVHRRQKLLKYLQRKERGGPRFQNVVEVLGLTPGAWEGEISLR